MRLVGLASWRARATVGDRTRARRSHGGCGWRREEPRLEGVEGGAVEVGEAGRCTREELRSSGGAPGREGEGGSESTSLSVGYSSSGRSMAAVVWVLKRG